MNRIRIYLLLFYTFIFIDCISKQNNMMTNNDIFYTEIEDKGQSYIMINKIKKKPDIHTLLNIIKRDSIAELSCIKTFKHEKDKYLCLKEAINNNKFEIFEFMLICNNFSLINFDELFRVALINDNAFKYIKYLIDHTRKNNQLIDLFERNFEIVENHEDTPLALMLVFKGIKFIKLIEEELMSCKIDINIFDKEGCTPLIYSCIVNNIDLFLFLFKIEGINKDFKDIHNKKAVDYANIFLNSNITKLLDPDAPDNNIENNLF
ncbi:MAG: ankyrin repeat domain-containing protein [Bacteroidetes bacterium]|nr:ankyrin repeat domain-containing protein [Bacteroidota bacterium]